MLRAVSTETSGRERELFLNRSRIHPLAALGRNDKGTSYPAVEGTDGSSISPAAEEIIVMSLLRITDDCPGGKRNVLFNEYTSVCNKPLWGTLHTLPNLIKKWVCTI